MSKVVAVTGGKGGTGKTTVAVSLARLLPGKVVLVDADAECPNAFLFLKPRVWLEEETVYMSYPIGDPNRCTLCGRCANACPFGALALVPGKRILFFDYLCHGCMLCKLVCPKNAISEGKKPIGVVRVAEISENLTLVEARSAERATRVPAVISTAKEKAFSLNPDIVIVDTAPGASCPVVEALEGADFAVVVVEATPFGLSDFEMIKSLLDEMGVPFGVAINRAVGDVGDVVAHLKAEGVRILAQIPYLEDAFRNISRGVLPLESPEMRGALEKLAEEVARL